MFGNAKVARDTKSLKVIDFPKDAQLATNIIRCPGINSIPNRGIVFYNGGLHYRPNRGSGLVPVASNGDHN